jgi:hypothetical protein
MPIPSRNENENANDYMSRCMSDSSMQKEYPDDKNRIAACMGKATESCDPIEAAGFNIGYEEGYSEDITEENFYVPLEAEYEDFGEEIEEWDVSIAKPGLWENIQKKKERMGKKYKPAKPGDPDRPDKDAFKKAQSGGDSEMAIEQIMKMHDQLMEVVAKMQTMQIPVEFQDWTKDMISKAEIYVQNVYDFVKYYEPGKYEDENEDKEESYSSEYQGRKVTLNKPFRTSNGPKKFAVYVKNESGNVVIVRFGDPNMTIKKNIPERRKSFRARHNCDNPGPRWKARFWSCKAW